MAPLTVRDDPARSSTLEEWGRSRTAWPSITRTWSLAPRVRPWDARTKGAPPIDTSTRPEASRRAVPSRTLLWSTLSTPATTRPATSTVIMALDRGAMTVRFSAPMSVGHRHGTVAPDAGRDGQAHDERRAPAWLRGGVEGAAVGGDDALHERETEAQAAVAAGGGGGGLRGGVGGTGEGGGGGGERLAGHRDVVDAALAPPPA